MSDRERYNKLRLLRGMYSSKSNAELAEILGMSSNHIAVMAHRMGLRKDPKFLSDTNRRCGRQGLIVMGRVCFSEK